MIFSFGVRLILLLLLIGGIIAIVGDYMGHIIGRRRLTIFGLRPRHTAFLITILTGILSVFITIVIILTVSQDARTALFGLENLRQEMSENKRQLQSTKDEMQKVGQDLAATVAELAENDQKLENTKQDLEQASSNLEQAKQEIKSLSATRDKLKKEVELSRQGMVMFRNNQVILTSLIQAGPEKNKLETGLKQILSAADAYVRSLGVESDKHLIYVSPEEFNQAVATLQKQRDENIIKVIATRNTVFGEETPVRLEIIDNVLIYSSGQLIAQTSMEPVSLSIPEIEQRIKKLLVETNQIAKDDGVVPDPSGSIGSIPYSQIYSLAKRIKDYKSGINLKVYAKNDIYSIGPLELEFKIFYQ